MYYFCIFFVGKKAEQEIKLVQLKKLIEFFIVSEVILIRHNYHNINSKFRSFLKSIIPTLVDKVHVALPL